MILAAKDSNSTIFSDGMNNFELQELLAEELAEIYSMINAHIGRDDHLQVRVQLIKLPARRNVLPHVDFGHIFTVTNRFHIPIITNKNVDFFIQLTKVPMDEGKLIEINNQVLHCVFNQSDLDRVHMIIDWGHKDFK